MRHRLGTARAEPRAARTDGRCRRSGCRAAAELFATGFTLDPAGVADGAGGAVVTALRRWAARYGKAVAGSVAVAENGRFYNRMYFVKPSGEFIGYDKRHLFAPGGEARQYTPGDSRAVVEYGGVRFLLLVCYDLRFPELFRHLALQGAQLIFCPAEWPEARGDIWRLLAQARAAENHTFVVAVNCAGSFKGAPFYGHSMVVAPSGKILAEAGMQEEVVSCEIDLADVARVRSRLNALADVRKELIQ